MICLYCGNSTQVVNSRKQKKNSHIWRRRSCNKCLKVFTTFESFDTSTLILSRDLSGHPEHFSSTKLLISIYESCRHRKTAEKDASALTETVINQLLGRMRQEIISTKDIQQLTQQALHNFDRTAEVHYKAYYPSKS